jgi:hypothetical protein
MEDVIEVMKLLCYEMMELQRTQQEAGEAPGQNTQVVWELLQQQADTLVVLLTTQTGQVRLVVLCCDATDVMWRLQAACCCRS